MPMIDIYATAGTFSDTRKLAADAAAVVKGVENVPDIPMFRQNTAAFVHEMAAGTIANVDAMAPMCAFRCSPTPALSTAESRSP